jgi:transposase InsO family protein
MQPRVNQKVADVLAQAVVIDALSGVATAWAFLQAHDVPTDTILRVLSSASVRRQSDTPSLSTIDKCRGI